MAISEITMLVICIFVLLSLHPDVLCISKEVLHGASFRSSLIHLGRHPSVTFSKLACVESYSRYLAKKISSLSFTDNLNTSEMLKISDALKSTVPLSLVYSVSLDTPVFSAIETMVIPESLILLLSKSNFTKLSSPPLLNFIHIHTIAPL